MQTSMSELSLIKNPSPMSTSNIPDRSTKKNASLVIPFRPPNLTVTLHNLLRSLNHIFYHKITSYEEITSVLFALKIFHRISEDDWNVVIYSLLSAGYPDKDMCMNIHKVLKEHIHLPQKIKDTLPTIDHWFDHGNLKLHFQNMCKSFKTFWTDTVFEENTSDFQKGWTSVHALFELKMYGPLIWFFQQMSRINPSKTQHIFVRFEKINIGGISLVSIPSRDQKQFGVKVDDMLNKKMVQSACDVLADVCKQLYEQQILQKICVLFDAEFEYTYNYSFVTVYDAVYHLIAWYKREDLIKILHKQMFDISPQHAKDVFIFAKRAGIVD